MDMFKKVKTDLEPFPHSFAMPAISPLYEGDQQPSLFVEQLPTTVKVKRYFTEIFIRT